MIGKMLIGYSLIRYKTKQSIGSDLYYVFYFISFHNDKTYSNGLEQKSSIFFFFITLHGGAVGGIVT